MIDSSAYLRNHCLVFCIEIFYFAFSVFFRPPARMLLHFNRELSLCVKGLSNQW